MTSEPIRWRVGEKGGPCVIKLFDHAKEGIVVCLVIEAGTIGQEHWEVGTRPQVLKTELRQTIDQDQTGQLRMKLEVAG